MNKAIVDSRTNLQGIVVRLPLLEAVPQDKIRLILDLLKFSSEKNNGLTDQEQEIVTKVLQSTKLSDLEDWRLIEFRNVLNKTHMIVEFDYHQTELFDKTFGLPSQYKSFYGRKEEYKVLVENFNTKPKKKQKIAGTAGSGKTVFENYFAHRRLEEGFYQWVIWLTGSSKKDLVVSYLSSQMNQLAFELGLNIIQLSKEKLYREIYKCMSLKGRGLIVFDNIPDYSDIIIFQPNDEFNDLCDVLITSQNAIAVGKTVTQIPLNVFDNNDAKGYAMAMLDKINITEEEAVLIAKTLGNHPLAMTQVFACIEQNSTVSDFCDNYNRLHESREYYLNYSVPDDDPYQLKETEFKNKATMYTVVNVTLGEIKANAKDLYDDILLVLKAAAYLAPEIMIPKALLSVWLSNNQGNIKIDKILDILRKYSFIEESSERLSYRIHQVIQDVISVKDSSNDSIRMLKEWKGMIKKVLKYSGNMSRLEKEKMYIRLKCHMDRLIYSLLQYLRLDGDSEIDRELEEIIETLAQFNRILGKSEKLQGDEKKALEHFKEELSLYKKLRSDNQDKKMICTMNIAAMELYAGNFRETKPLLAEIAPFFNGKKNDKEGFFLFHQGNLTLTLGDANQALRLFNHALSVFKSRKPPKPHKIGITLMNLGSAYQVLDKSEEAIRYFNEALKLLQGIFKDNHPSIARCIINIAHEYQKREEIEKARESYNQAELILKSSLGENHADVGRCVMSIALTYFTLSYQKAIELLNKAYNILNLSLDKKHPDIGRCFLNKGLALYNCNRHEDSKECFQDALNILKEIDEESTEVKLCQFYLKELNTTADYEKKYTKSYKAYPLITECFQYGVQKSSTRNESWEKTRELLESYYSQDRVSKEVREDRVKESIDVEDSERELVEYLTNNFGSLETVNYKKNTF